MAITDSVTWALEVVRRRTLGLVEPFSDAQMERSHSELMSPLVWDLAHIAAYEDLWLVHRHGGEPLLRPELLAMYDAFETPRPVRGDLPLLDRSGALDYLAAVRERVVALLERTGPETVHEMVLQHEQQHSETMLQAIELARFDVAPGLVPAPRPSAERLATGLESVEVPAGPFTMGADPGRFAFDNERPRHRVQVAAFRIGRTPITNATFLRFVEGGGYQRREWWSDEGWSWKEDYDITHPGGWALGPTGWQQWRVDGWAQLHPAEPVVHVSWFEADAFARAHAARLPTEAEWEKAAAWDQETQTARRYPWGDEPPEPGDGRANLDQTGLGPWPAGSLSDGAAPCGAFGMLGDVWEWTASDFNGYPGFVPHPYREYSEVFFGTGHKSLRGGSWATRAAVATPCNRNWDLPERRQIFSGFRLAWTP